MLTIGDQDAVNALRFFDDLPDRRSEVNRLHRLGGVIVIAWASDCGITFGQVATDEKSNVIAAIPQLLEIIDVEDAVVTIDASGCHKHSNIMKRGWLAEV